MTQDPLENSATGGVAAVDRALAIAGFLARASAPCSLADIARGTGLYKSTVLRLITSLEHSGLVIHRSDRQYALGPLAFLFGRSFETTHGFRQTIEPILEWLVKHGTESPSFHVRNGVDTRVCLFRIDSSHSTLDRVSPGMILPLDRGAAGRVLVAFEKGDSADSKVPLVVCSYGERDPICGGVAAPVFGPSGILMGALSLSGPLERFSELSVGRMSSLIETAAANATKALGGSWPVRMASKPVPPKPRQVA